MGHHYVPQEYLRGFADPGDPGMIWMYDKQDRQFRYVPIKAVAQEPGYYSPENEQRLNDRVEGPANIILKKLRAGQQMDDVERTTLTDYIGTMIKRVPHRRRMLKEMAPGVVDRTINELANQIVQFAQDKSVDPEWVAKRLEQLEQLRTEYKTNLPEEIKDYIREPWPSKTLLSCIRTMTWRILPAPPEEYFLTSDNPAVYFDDFGLGRLGSELTFPLSSDLALIANWQGSPFETIFLQDTKKLKKSIREVHRRVACGAERFVFYHAKKDWVGKVADKKHVDRRVIKWQ